MKFLLMFLLLSGHAFARDHYVVHEWGTFTSLVGSDGVRQNGMYHEDEVLPLFVHNFGEELVNDTFKSFLGGRETTPTPKPAPLPIPDPTCGRHTKLGCNFLANQFISQKMETPVLYFHTNKERNVSVEVGFPGGVIAQTYPAPTMSLPLPEYGVALTNGSARFDVKVLTQTALTPPEVAKDNIYSYAREAAANTIVSHGEVEKFIFYRGIGKFETNLSVTSKNGAMKLQNISVKKIPQVFLVDSNENGGSILALGSLSQKEFKNISENTLLALATHHQDLEIFGKLAKEKLLSALVANGLYADEAKAMVDTWEHGYFKTPGLRVLYVLDRSEVEGILPMKISPAPETLNRVFVGRIEVLLDTKEDEVLKTILRDGKSFNIVSLGRFAPSILLRIKELAQKQNLMTADLASTFDYYDSVIAEKF